MNPWNRLLPLIGIALALLAALGWLVPAGVVQPSQASGSARLSDVVVTEQGKIRGAPAPRGTAQVFEGLPYAAPPIGTLRWAPPAEPASWPGVRDATRPGSPCPQTGRLASTEEDCLYLNVTRPRTAEKQLPVMVFLHGGGQRQSAGHEYDAERLVTEGRPAVHVSINYRLNIFAFLGHPSLTAEHPELGSGNYAALDQIQALRWVEQNIRSFGGDPENVTVFGESGGAQAVCVLLASPVAEGLFDRAISQSGPCQWEHYPSLTASEDSGLEIASALGCAGASDVLACLRSRPTDEVLALERGATDDTGSAQPAWGGGVMPYPLRETAAMGLLRDVPFMQGSNSDEALYRLATRFEGREDGLAPEQYPVLLDEYFGASRVDAIEAEYPLADYDAPIYALSAALSDAGLVSNNRIGLCNTLLANRLVAPHQPLYSFEFADETAPYPAPIFDAPGELKGAAHTTELSYLFDQVPLTREQRALSRQMIQYWTNFATSGDPNGRGLPRWPRFTPETPVVMELGAAGPRLDEDFEGRHKCQFWSEQGISLLAGPFATPTDYGARFE